MVDNNSRHLATSYSLVLILTTIVYVISCAPGAVWQDSGMLQYRVWHNDIRGGLGLALSHPLFYILAIGVKYVPFGESVYKVNLVSAITGAIAVANLFLLLRLWLGKNTPAIMAATALALSHTFWQHACVVETYDLYAALFLAELIVLLQYVKTARVGYLYGLGFLNGLSIAEHMLGSIPLLCYAVFFIVLLVRKNIRFRHLAVIIFLWIVGAAPYEYLIVKNFIQTGDFAATIASVFFGDGFQGNVLNTSISSRIIKENLILMAYNFPTPNILFFFAGLYGLRKLSPGRSFANVFLALLILFFAFAFRYTVPDRYAFFIPFYCLVAVLVGAGFDLLVAQPGHKVLCWAAFILAMLPIPIYIVAPIAAEKTHFNLSTMREIPYRNEYVWFLRPWQTGYNGAERFAKEALGGAEKDSIIIADGTTVYPIWYVQTIKAMRPDVKVVSFHKSYQNPVAFPTEDTIGQLMANHAIYVVSPIAGYCPRFLFDQYNFVQAGVVWRMVERKTR